MSRMSLAPGRAREYETIFILRPSVDKEAVEAITTRTIDAVKGQDGHLTEMELWGRRRLAYTIQRHHRGVYVYMKYLGRGNVVAELERQLRLVDDVIRYQTILVRNNVPFAGAELPEAQVDLEVDLPVEPDEPEMSRERELGLEGGPPERDRRGRRDDRGRDFSRGPAESAEGAASEADERPSSEAAPPDAKPEGGESAGESADESAGESEGESEGEATEPTPAAADQADDDTKEEG